MISVERVRSYCQIGTEAARDTESDKNLPESWPSGGSIVFKDVSLRYRPSLPRVLKGLDIEFPKRSKIGVVGRTGAGKSTLMVSLLRIVEVDSGKILIDGCDTKKIGLTKQGKYYISLTVLIYFTLDDELIWLFTNRLSATK